MKYKILIDDYGIIESFKQSVSMTFRNFIDFIPIILLFGLNMGINMGIVKGLNMWFSNSFWLTLIVQYILTLPLIFCGVVFLVKYLNLDYLENQESYEIVS